MLHITFENPTLPKVDAGPFESLEVTVEALWGMPGRVRLATHEGPMWRGNDDHYYTSITIRTPCLLRFKHNDEDCSTARAREDEARIADGAIYHGDRLIAKLNEAGDAWWIYEDQSDCNRAEI